MLVSLVECKQGGIWTGNPELGLWCNSEPPNSSLTSENNYTALQIYLIFTFITRLEFFQSKGLMVDDTMAPAPTRYLLILSTNKTLLICINLYNFIQLYIIYIIRNFTIKNFMHLLLLLFLLCSNK